MKKKLPVFFLFFIFSYAVCAQQSSIAYQTLADSLYRYHHYQAAAEYYQKALRKSSQSAKLMLQIAKSYSKTNAVKEAEAWFTKAKAIGASFSNDDVYQYARVLIALEKRKEAETLLSKFLEADPNALRARETLEDIHFYKRYYKDSTDYSIQSLSINTTVSEFAPVYYKEGIVFSSATQEKVFKKKYHWDGSNYLNLYYSKKLADQTYQKPLSFAKELNTRYHDGPASFYDGYKKMIVNRNQAVKATGAVDTWVWHLSLFDAQQPNDKSVWQVTPLPFDQPPYSMAHPAISEDGTVLYFISDKPGGYGGTDMYRTIRTEGVWSEPFNLGPSVNTTENEVFPFLIQNTLYFASDGHGGLGGLDIFKSDYTVNGFSPPINMGFPINSIADDFSCILSADLRSGYFASARNGNDDIFSFQKKADLIQTWVHLYDGQTNLPLAGATIQLISGSGDDFTLTSDDQGDFRFTLPEETAYMVVGTKDGVVGMLTGISLPEEDYTHITHQMPAYGDTARIACIGFIKNVHGIKKDAAVIKVTDETTGKKIAQPAGTSIVNFLGEKNHAYRIEIQNEQGDTTLHTFKIQPDERGTRNWTMILKERPATMHMAARIFDANNEQPLGGAEVKIITFSEPDQEMLANAEGIVDFLLPPGTAYMVIGSKNNLSGMHAGMAEPGSDKASIIHPVPAHGDPPPPVPVRVLALLTNELGEALSNPSGKIIDKVTGESIPTQIENGVLSFLAVPGKAYNIDVQHKGHQTTLDQISVPTEGAEVLKISVVLPKNIPALYNMAAKVFKAVDQTPLNGAEVRIMSFSEADQEMVADADGKVEFTLSEGTTYMIVGSKGGFVGMHSGTVEPGTDKASVIHPVPATDEPEKQLPVMARITNKKGEELNDAVVTISEKNSNEKVQAKIENGLVSFVGIKGKEYTIEAEHSEHFDKNFTISIPTQATEVPKVIITMEEKVKPVYIPIDTAIAERTKKLLPVAGLITDKQGQVVRDAEVTITEKNSGLKIPAQIKDGVLSFTGKQGEDYLINVNHEGFQNTEQAMSIAEDASGVQKITIALENNTTVSVQYQMAAKVFKASDNSPLSGADVKVISFIEPDQELVANHQGVVEFALPEGTSFMIIGSKDGYVGMYSGTVETGMDKATLTIPVPAKGEKLIPVVALVRNERGVTVTQAEVKVTDKKTGEKVSAKIENGILSFLSDKNKDYKVEVSANNYKPTEKSMRSVDTLASRLITLQAVSKDKFEGTRLIVLDTEQGTSKVYIGSQNSFGEIVERGGTLYLEDGKKVVELGKGSLTNLTHISQRYSQALGLSGEPAVHLRSIYFDYNTAVLDDEDKIDLNKVSDVLKQYSALKLLINAHADDRGNEIYNMNLSRQRAKAVGSYLVKKGIAKHRSITKAFGESLPAVRCETAHCTEDDHKKNRRAEFVLSFNQNIKATSEAINGQSKNTTLDQTILTKYGSKSLQLLEFKISIGAYRFNSTLTFNELLDLGKVESNKVDGISCYYLGSFATLNEVELARQKVLQRGINDAGIIIFYKGNKIDFTHFTSLVDH